MNLIPLYARDGSVRAYARVDAEDVDRLAGHRWHLSTSGYAVRNVRVGDAFRTIFMHREVRPDGEMVDHINRNPLDNRRANLRPATCAENLHNQVGHSDGRSRHRGVDFRTADGKWRARVAVGGRRYVLGVFDSEEAAAAAAEEFRRTRVPFSPEAVSAGNPACNRPTAEGASR